MLIVEGADCVGKSALVNKLVIELQRLVGDAEVTSGHLGQEGRNLGLSGHLALIKRWHVQDRFHLSELAYSREFRDGVTLMHPLAVATLEKRLCQVGAMIVIVSAAEGVYGRLLGLHHSRGEDFEDQAALSRINMHYRNVPCIGHLCPLIHASVLMDRLKGQIIYVDQTSMVEIIARAYYERQLGVEKNHAY